MSDILNTQIFQEMSALMEEDFPKMLDIFLTDTANYIEECTTCLQGDDFKQINMIAHTIKSSSRQLGAISLADQSEAVETLTNAAKDGALLHAEKKEQVADAIRHMGVIFKKSNAAMQTANR